MATSKFVDTINTALRDLGITQKSGPVIVALSGGADSVALLSALTRLGYRCVAAHCDFHLRGDESERDRRHAEAIAEKSGAEYEETHFDVEEYKRTHHVSTEMACRELRYEWFGRLSEKHGGIPVAVAHHHDDNVETMFLNLLRGTGIGGLTGMKPRNGIIVRPMLRLTRAQIEEYLRSEGIGFMVDSTNLINDVKRNRLRNIILPELHRQFPDCGKALSTTMDNLGRTESLYRELTEKAAKQFLSDDGMQVDLKRLTSEVGESATMLYEIIRRHGFNYTQASDIIKAYRGDTPSGRLFMADGWQAALNRGTLLLTPADRAADDGDTCFDIDLSREGIYAPGIEVSIVGRDELVFDRTGLRIYLDGEVLKGSPLFQIRHWKEGDRIEPFGMKGSRLVSDIFSDAKLTIAEKRQKWILTRNGRPIWVVGMRASRHFPVSTESSTVIALKFQPFYVE